MKRSKVAAVLAAGLLLTACGTSISGSPVPGVAGQVGTTEGTTTSTEDTSTEDTSTEDTSTEDTSTEDTSTEDTSTETTTEDTEPVDVLDEDTTAWFVAFCNSVTPLLQVETIEDEASAAAGPADLQVIYVENYGAMADGLIESGEAMSAMNPPSVPGGEEAATTYSSGILDIGTRLRAGMDEFALADPKGDIETFKSSAMAALDPVSEDLPGVLTAIDSMKLTVQQQREILELPECVPVGDFVEGGD